MISPRAMRLRRPVGEMPESVEPVRWGPTERQERFIVGAGGVYEAMYGGARMGGKTDALLVWVFLRRQKYARSRGLFVRRNLTEILKQGAAWDRAKRLLGAGAVFNETNMTITFANGSVEEFGHCKDDAALEHYKGSQYDDIVFDQLEEFTEQQYLLIQAACRVAQSDEAPRDVNGVRIQARVRASANPGGIGHSWVKKTFIDPARPEDIFTRVLEVENQLGVIERIERQRVFIPSTVFDNPYASDEYKATLASLPEPYRSMYLYGTWDVFVGQAFSDFHPIHPTKLTPYHVIDVADIPEHWERVEFLDWGYSHPFVCLWAALDPEGGAIIYRELWARGWKPKEQAKQILRMRGTEQVYETWCGLDLWYTNQARSSDPTEKVESLESKPGATTTIVYQYGEEGLNSCFPTKSTDRIFGKQMIHSWLADRGDGVPWLRIMKNCEKLIETMQLIPLSEFKTEDVQKDIDPQLGITDDPYDALRYGLVSLGSPGVALGETGRPNLPTVAVPMETR